MPPPPPPGWHRLRPLQTALLGSAIAVLISLLAAQLDALLPPRPQADVAPSPAHGLLASFYGGIAEELLLRLFLMTLSVWLLTGFGRRLVSRWMAWASIVFCALLFGAGHLPAAAALWGLQPVLIVRTLLLNGIAGVLFGWLYWRRGLEMAMLAHFCADLVLHVLVPLLR